MGARKKIVYDDSGEVYSPADIRAVLEASVNKRNLLGNSKGVYYYNVPCSFDIEVTSFYRDEFGAQYTYDDIVEMQERTGKKV